jgi:hypothetical protein
VVPPVTIAVLPSSEPIALPLLYAFTWHNLGTDRYVSGS